MTRCSKILLSTDCFLKDQCAKYKRNNCVDNSFCLKLFKIEALFSNSLLPKHKWNRFALYIDKDNTDKKEFKELRYIEKTISDFIESGKNLYLCSSTCGNGKTSWAIRLIQSYFNNIWPSVDVDKEPCKALFINLPNFFIQLKNNISKQNDYIDFIKRYVLECDLIVWDDVGTKAGTEFEMENFLSILDYRLCCGKSNIYTSNILPQNLSQYLDVRLCSRILNQNCDIICLNGQDKRGVRA